MALLILLLSELLNSKNELRKKKITKFHKVVKLTCMKRKIIGEVKLILIACCGDVIWLGASPTAEYQTNKNKKTNAAADNSSNWKGGLGGVKNCCS